MSYTAPSGSVWQVTSNYDIYPSSGYYRAYTGEFRGSPSQNPQNDIHQSCSFACDSKPDCAAWALDGNGSQCYIIGGNVKTLRSYGGRKAYVRTSARPAGIYSTIAQGVTIVRVTGGRVTEKARRFRIAEETDIVLKIIRDLLAVQLNWGLPSLEIS